MLGDLFLEAHPVVRAQIILDLDATDLLLPGHQEQRFLDESYDKSCDLALDIFGSNTGPNERKG